jgi:hypothetical protein
MKPMKTALSVAGILVLVAACSGTGSPGASAAGESASGSVEPSAPTSIAPSSEPSSDALFSPATSTSGAIHGTVEPSVMPPPIGELHDWVLHLEDGSGVPIEEATVTVVGDMPAHGHGLASQPLVREYVGNGDYLVEGIEFQMGGEWYVEFTITQGEVVDTIRFAFDLPE